MTREPTTTGAHVRRVAWPLIRWIRLTWETRLPPFAALFLSHRLVFFITAAATVVVALFSQELIVQSRHEARGEGQETRRRGEVSAEAEEGGTGLRLRACVADPHSPSLPSS